MSLPAVSPITVSLSRPDHSVQFYENDRMLFDTAGAFLAAGIHAEQAVVIIATESHAEGLLRSLAACGVAVDDARRSGQLTLLDASEVMATFMVGDLPDEGRFMANVGGLVADAMQSTGRTSVRAYGEMVDLLWQEGRTEAAIRLEELWHDLAGTQPLSLLCAYAMGRFYGETHRSAYDEVCRRHTHVIPASDGAPAAADSLQTELDHRRRLEAALREALQARRHAERALREREAELRDFIENAAEGLHWVGADGTILWANQTELDMLGYTREEYIGRPIADFHADPTVVDDILGRLARNETIRNREARLRCRDGNIRDVLITSNVLWRDGRFQHTRCFTRDITGWRQAEEQRLRAERHLRAQYAVTRVLADAPTLAGATPRLLQTVCEITGWRLGAIWAVDEPRNRIQCVDVWHDGADLDAFAEVTRQSAFPPGVGLPGRIWQHGTPAWIADVVTDGNFPRAPVAARVGLHGAFGFPIRVHDRITGVIECFSSEVREPDEQLLQLFDAIGTQIGQFMERRQVEEARERLAAIVESTDDPVIGKSLDGIITAWNPAAERTFGYTAAEAVGRHITIVVPEERHAEEAEVLASLRRGEKVDHVETERSTRDGRRLSVSLTVSPIHDAAGGIIGAATIVRDVSAQRRAHDELRRSERVARFLADASTALAEVTDYRSTLQRIAELAVPTFADWCTVDIATDEGWLERLAVTHTDPAKTAFAYDIQRRWPPPPDAAHGPVQVMRTGRAEMMADIPDALVEAAAQDEAHLRALRTLGLRSFISVPIRSEQKIYGVITFVTAESARRYEPADLLTAEDLARRAAVAIENVVLYEELQRAVRTRDEFLSIAGHELRNPLNALQLQLVGLLRAAHKERRPVSPDWVTERVGQAVEDVERLVRLVHNLLDVTRIEAGRLDLEPEHVDLVAVVDAVARRLRPQLADGQLSIRAAAASGYWDRLRLEQIVTNLLSNAIKYGDGKPIEVTLEARDDAAVLRVADHGIGIEPARQETIFGRFERGVARRQFGGFGLGLWITRSLVEAMGGRVSVESRPGAGSTFSVSLPRGRSNS